MKCLRCDWRSDPEAGGARDQLLEHADEAAHPICTVCVRSLKLEELRVCEPCLTESRSLLAGITLMWQELPRHLGQLGATVYDQRVSSSKDKPLTGGGRLVLAGPGATGGNPRRLTPKEQERSEQWWLPGRSGPLTQAGLMDTERRRTGREHVVDNKPTDGTSIEQVLVAWEDDWRSSNGDPAAIVSGGRGGTAATIRHAAGYLETHARWAANEHDSFPDYVADLRQLHAALERSTGRDEPRWTTEARCFQCSGTLERRLTDCGFEDDWTCHRCGERYDWPRFILALKAQLESAPTAGWSLPDHVAVVLGVKVETVRTWAKRGHVSSACLVGDSHMRVSYEEVVARVRRLEEARVRAAARAAEKASEAKAS